MIMICERCCAPITQGESLVRLAHVDQSHADGSVTWVYAFVHLDVCVAPRPARHERPNTAGWDASRGIRGHRA
jgi:hypothetical protein